MPYTNNVPQGNQTIASTTDPIRNNFAFIQTDLQVEHSFNGNVAGLAEGVHLRASMPNQADPVALPAGSNGIYYVSGSLPKFFNGTPFFVQVTPQFQNILTGTVTLSSSGAATPVVTLPSFSYGYYLIGPTAASTVGADDASAMGFLVSSTNSMQVGAVSDPGIDITNVNRSLRAKLTSSSWNGTYKYTLIYYTPGP